MSEFQKEIAFLFILKLPCIISILLFFYGVIRTMYRIIRHFICKYKYRKLIKHHMNVCLQCEKRLYEDAELRREVLSRKMRSFYLYTV